MAKPFDSATKHLILKRPADWLAYVGLPRLPVDIVDADLSSISAASDKLLIVRAEEPWIAHLELQSTYEPDMIDRFHFYSVVESWHKRLPVHLSVVLLRPEADGPAATGELRRHWPDGTCYERFLYSVVRVWEKPVEEVLAGGIGTLPLAPICDVRANDLPSVLDTMRKRFDSEVAPNEAQDYWTATYLLMGLRYEREQAKRLLQGVRNMRESVTYQEILEEGRQEGERKGRREGRQEGRQEGRHEGAEAEARRMLLLVGSRRFGPPSPQLQARVDAIRDVARLEDLISGIFDVESWDDLMGRA